MQTIWKYPLDITDEQIISVPIGANFLSVQLQGDQPHLWAKVDPFRDKEDVRIITKGTGHDIEEGSVGDYISTYQWGGSLVFHVFVEGGRQ